jgi:hypothetical protein
LPDVSSEEERDIPVGIPAGLQIADRREDMRFMALNVHSGYESAKVWIRRAGDEADNERLVGDIIRGFDTRKAWHLSRTNGSSGTKDRFPCCENHVQVTLEAEEEDDLTDKNGNPRLRNNVNYPAVDALGDPVLHPVCFSDGLLLPVTDYPRALTQTEGTARQDSTTRRGTDRVQLKSGDQVIEIVQGIHGVVYRWRYWLAKKLEQYLENGMSYFEETSHSEECKIPEIGLEQKKEGFVGEDDRTAAYFALVINIIRFPREKSHWCRQEIRHGSSDPTVSY